MDKTTKVSDLPEFDIAEHLRNEADIAEYLTQVIADGDAAELAHAPGVAVRSRGMAQEADGVAPPTQI